MSNDEVLVHPVDWPKIMRYATHERNAGWRPPLVSLEVAHLRDLTWRLTPFQLAVYVALIAEYAGAPALPR